MIVVPYMDNSGLHPTWMHGPSRLTAKPEQGKMALAMRNASKIQIGHQQPCMLVKQVMQPLPATSTSG